MSGENNLSVLLMSAAPRLHDGRFIFCTLISPDAALLNEAILIMKEDEGTTLILPQDVADASGISYEYVAGWITLEIHSSLAAVGLTAAFSAALAAQQISCNVVAGYYHDHIFVDADDNARAMTVLSSLG